MHLGWYARGFYRRDSGYIYCLYYDAVGVDWLISWSVN
jgi:hypothetical protein